MRERKRMWEIERERESKSGSKSVWEAVLGTIPTLICFKSRLDVCVCVHLFTLSLLYQLPHNCSGWTLTDPVLSKAYEVKLKINKYKLSFAINKRRHLLNNFAECCCCCCCLKVSSYEFIKHWKLKFKLWQLIVYQVIKTSIKFNKQ